MGYPDFMFERFRNRSDTRDDYVDENGGGVATAPRHDTNGDGVVEERPVAAAPVTDDAMLVELLGVPVHAVRGASQSLKITTPLDLIIAEGLLEGPLGVRWVEG